MCWHEKLLTILVSTFLSSVLGVHYKHCAALQMYTENLYTQSQIYIFFYTLSALSIYVNNMWSFYTQFSLREQDVYYYHYTLLFLYIRWPNVWNIYEQHQHISIFHKWDKAGHKTYTTLWIKICSKLCRLRYTYII